MLARWWERKYRQPSNHELFQERTIFDLYVEFLVDRYEEKPIESYRNAEGHIQLTDTGDDLVDRWEEQIAKGEEPNLWEAFDEESIKHLEKIKRAAKARDPYSITSMKDTYDKISRQAEREGLTVGKGNIALSSEQKDAMLRRLAEMPTFGGDPDED